MTCRQKNSVNHVVQQQAISIHLRKKSFVNLCQHFLFQFIAHNFFACDIVFHNNFSAVSYEISCFRIWPTLYLKQTELIANCDYYFQSSLKPVLIQLSQPPRCLLFHRCLLFQRRTQASAPKFVEISKARKKTRWKELRNQKLNISVYISYSQNFTNLA